MDAAVRALLLGGRDRWDPLLKTRSRLEIVAVPFGCPDWGSPGGVRNELCSFCSLPNGAEAFWREHFPEELGSEEREEHLLDLFTAALDVVAADSGVDRLAVFNSGSFLAMPQTLQLGIVERVTRYPAFRHLEIESRAQLITEASLGVLTSVLEPAGIALTMRIGVETQNDELRQRVLKKGHPRSLLRRAVAVARSMGVRVGGYALLNPAPRPEIAAVMGGKPTDEDLDRWVVDEAIATIDWILDDLGMDEVYFNPTSVPDVPVETPTIQLVDAWREGLFAPPTLWQIHHVLRATALRHPGRVQLGLFEDEPPFLAVPSNHVPGGITQDLSRAEGCDLVFHEMLERYRETLDPAVLTFPSCTCRPWWMS